MTMQKLLHWLFYALFLLPTFAYSQTATLTGTVVDAATGEPLVGASVVVQGMRYGSSTKANGTFEIPNLPAGTYKVVARYVGYQPQTLEATLTDGATVQLSFKLREQVRVIDEVVVTASKGRTEKKLDAPVMIETADIQAMRQSASPSPLGAVAKLKGIDFVERGINTVDIMSRGLNTQFNTRMLTLIDGRLATLPGLGLPQFMLAPNPASDLAAVEIVVGPAAALYGPNAHAGVVNMLTKNPFDYAGAELVVRGGTQSLYDINLRYADYAGNFGWKITGQWMDANQFESGNIFMFVPPTYIGQNQTLLNPETPNPLRITQATLDQFFNLGYAYRETEVSAMRAGLRKLDGGLYYRTDDFNVRFMAGVSSSTGFVGSNFGVLEANEYQIQYQSLQANGSLGGLGFFLQVTRTANDAGKSFQLHDRAEWFAREVIRLRSLPGGASLTRDQALAQVRRSFIDSASATIDQSQLWDSELQLRYDLAGFELVGGFQYRFYNPKASYLSNNPNINLTNVSNFLAIDITATEIGGYLQIDKRFLDNKLRLTLAARLDDHTYYDPQFSPKVSIGYEVADNQNIRLGYNRAFKVPVILENHLFLFNGAARGNVGGYTVRDGAPDAQGNPTGNVVAVYNPLRPEEVNAFEVGYKGLFERKLFVDFVAFYSRYTNFISPAFQIADGVRTFAYDNRTNRRVGVLEDAQGRPLFPGVAGQLTTYFNYGAATIAGFDLGLSYYLNSDVFFEGSMSYMSLLDSDNPFAAQGIPLLLNAPNWKFKGTLTMRNQLVQGTYAILHARHIPSYTFRAGRWNGTLNDRTVVDLTIGYEWKDLGITIQGSINNIFDNQTPDVVGAPIMRRFFSAQLSYALGSLINR
ncbi:MAG: TonB-dependent receptor [Chloroherpetonaceae bacterium]|nr:TonB-dependent receptor [Chloroherpetonaceae bacterium]MDW8465596.1 TonB-dependent receptor [Chloroherpetonaceae bacterium]